MNGDISTHYRFIDKKLPRVANMDKKVDGLQMLMAAQYKQSMYDRALVRYPQCRSNVFAPSIYDDFQAPGTPDTTPRTSLGLSFVYGFNNGAASSNSQSTTTSSNCSNANNLLYLSTGEIMWFSAALVILYSKENNLQRYFRQHTNEVTSMSLHPNMHVVASGQAGRNSQLLVWDANDEQLGKRVVCLAGHSVAVRCISFSHDGKLIASLGGDMFNTICIHDWRDQELLVTARGHSFRVHTLAFNPYQAYGRPETRRAKKAGQALHDDEACYTLVSCGVRHIRFWTLTKTEYVPPSTDEKEDSAFHGSAFGSPIRVRPPTPHAKMWKLEGNVPSFQGRLDVQDFTCLTFVDDSPPLYMYDEQSKELVASNKNDHTLGRIIAGTAKGDLCVFWQPRRGPDVDAVPQSSVTIEPAKWWEIPDEYTDAEINSLVVENIAFEPTARLVEVVPHDQETGNRYKLPKHIQLEMDNIVKRMAMKPNSTALQAQLMQLKYGGPLAHQGMVCQTVYCKKNNLIASCGSDGRIMLWKCHMKNPVRIPGVNTQGIFTPATGTFSEGSHALVQFDDYSKVFQLPLLLPGEVNNPNGSWIPKPTTLTWKEDGKKLLIGTSTNCVWELNVVSGDWQLIFEARSGAMVGCTCHPGKDEAATVSQDGYVSIWDLRRHICKRRMQLGNYVPPGIKLICMEFHPFGDDIAIGLSNGELLIIGYLELKVMVKKAIRSNTSSSADLHFVASSISQIKYCPNGKYLAVGAKDSCIHIYDIKNGYKKFHVCEGGHSSAVTQLTWSVEGDILQSNSSDGELLYWSISPMKGNTKQITDAFLIRDAQWIKWTSIFGWPTPGIWSEENSLVDIGAVCTTGPKATPSTSSHNEHMALNQLSDLSREDLIAVACKTAIRLFKWPALRGAKTKTFSAHSSVILSLCFSYNDNYLISAGGDDGAFLQWKCEASTTIASSKIRNFRNDGSEDFGSNEILANASPTPPGQAFAGQPSPRNQRRQFRERQDPVNEAEEGHTASLTDGSNYDPSGDVYQQIPAQNDNMELIPILNETPDLDSSLTDGNPDNRSDETTQYRATHDFEAENRGELSLRSGEVVRVLSEVNDEWWMGENCDGVKGIFPSNFVQEFSIDNPTHAEQVTEELANDYDQI